MNVADAGNLLSATGFNLCTGAASFLPIGLVVCHVSLTAATTVSCARSGHGLHPGGLPERLRAHGASARHGREPRRAVARRPASRDSLLAAASIYQSMFGQPDGTVPATFQVIYLIGWSPHESQQKPLRRGSAQHSLKELGHA